MMFLFDRYFDALQLLPHQSLCRLHSLYIGAASDTTVQRPSRFYYVKTVLQRWNL